MGETCALDIADRGGATLEQIGEAMNVTRERIRQIEAAGLRRLERSARKSGAAKELLLAISAENESSIAESSTASLPIEVESLAEGSPG